jgi:hypothetical protein
MEADKTEGGGRGEEGEREKERSILKEVERERRIIGENIKWRGLRNGCWKGHLIISHI